MRISDGRSDVCSSDLLTEVARTEGSGPIIVDDPVSSLDRDRSAKVADRIAEEAQKRQVVVFTHDMVFFNELCRAADECGIEPVTVALFSDLNAAGKIDPAGMVRSEEHTSELQSLMRISYAVFCLKKKNTTDNNETQRITQKY